MLMKNKYKIYKKKFREIIYFLSVAQISYWTKYLDQILINI